MKCQYERIDDRLYSVAPFAGAWIEMQICKNRTRRAASLPSRERGLKYPADGTRPRDELVAPFAGAWIEINGKKLTTLQSVVAPFAGAWIEICTPWG